jgi:betaine-aldehyde dehydrogenase
VITRRPDTGRRLVEHPTRRWSSITGSVRAGMEVARRRPPTSSGSTWNSAARPRHRASTTPTCGRGARASRSRLLQRGQDCTAATRCCVHEASTTSSSAALAGAPREDADGGPREEGSLRPAQQRRTSSRTVAGLHRPAARRTRTCGRRPAAGRRGYFYERDRRDRASAGRRGGAARDLRPVITVQRFTDEAQALAMANGVAVRPGGIRLDRRAHAGDAIRQAPRLRVRLDQHAHPVSCRTCRTAASSTPGTEGPLELRLRGLHAHSST